jgi:ABC-type transport system substrate-binding protein
VARRQLILPVVCTALLVLVAGACDRDDQTERLRPPTGEDVPAGGDEIVDRPRGGTARVGVWANPDVAAPTLGGAAVRALVHGQLFAPEPDGRWRPLLVEPGSDRSPPDRLTASFRLRRGAAWSDGTPMTADDLRRTADARFVAGVDGPAPDGTITVRFTQPLPGWRRLWSHTASIAPPREGAWGGPFVVASATSGLETVLQRNPAWVGGGPFLDEVRLVLVPDSTTARQLLERDELDVVMPPAATVRTNQLESNGSRVERARPGGWLVWMRLNRERLPGDVRRSLVQSVDREAFVETLLGPEALLLHGLAGPEDGTWAGRTAGDVTGMRGKTIDLAGTLEEPMTYLLERSMQKRARTVGAQLELRTAEADRVERWVSEGTYDAAIVMDIDGPDICWRCRWESVDAGLAAAADAGDAAAVSALQAKLRDDDIVLPLWRPVPVVAWRGDLQGVRANGFALSGAWNAWEWWRGSADEG